MALTNPDQDAYDDFAVQQLSQYLKQDGCSKVPAILGNTLEEQCIALIDQNQAQLKEFISTSTQRENFWVLSVYKTNLSASQLLPPIVSDSIPAYHFETIGVFQRFHVYKAEQR